jgi:nucleoside-diphosphate-sugar epimerase
MRIFVAGATGVAGLRSVRCLVAAGHEVTGVARTSSKAALLREAGAAPVEVDLFEAAEVRRALEGNDAVVNLATKIPPLSRAMLPGAWRENSRLRTHVSKNLGDGALATDVGRYVQESLAFMYPDRGREWIDEDVAVDPPGYAASTITAEEQARRFSVGGRSGVVLRFGQFYAPDATHTMSMLRTARCGWSPFIGPGDAFSPLVHAEDVASAVVASLGVPSGTYNVVDDEPLTNGELADALATALSVTKLRSVPPWLMRLGGAKARMLMRSQRVSNRRFRDATGWAPAFPTARDGFRNVADEAQGRAG